MTLNEKSVKKTFCTLRETNNFYIDALAGDVQNNLIFLSAWGRDTVIKDIIAKFSLPPRKGGWKGIYVYHQAWAEEKYYSVDVQMLDQQTARMPANALFGEVVHLWLYDKLTAEVDYVNRHCIVLKKASESEDTFHQRLWQAVKNLCALPLLEGWESLIGGFQAKGWIKCVPGFKAAAFICDFSSPALETFISDSIRSGKLRLSASVETQRKA